MRYTAYKYRIYPTKDQKVLIAKTLGCCRFVYNRALAIKTAFWEKEKKGLSMFKISKQMTKWKEEKDFEWLNQVNSQALQFSLSNLDRAYTKFFKEKRRFPKFKNKYGQQSFCNIQHTKVNWKNKMISFPKFKEGIKTIFHRKFDGKIKYSIVIKTPTNKYYIFIIVEELIENPLLPVPLEDKSIGIDLGIKTYAAFSDGTKILVI